MITEKQANDLWEMIKPIKVGMLTTEGPFIHARPMHLMQDEFNGTLWFFTSRTGDKIDEIQDNATVCVSFADPSKENYISTTGIAQLDTRRDKIEEFWNPFASAYFPKGKDDPDLALLRIDIHKAEYWDGDNSIVKDLFEIAKANITGEQPDMGDNRKVG